MSERKHDASLRAVAEFLDGELAPALAAHDVPAAAVAVYRDGDLVENAAGILNLATGVEATTDSLFQIGSITKVWTATLIMQLVEEGLVDLDAPVRSYLPQFRLADAEAAAIVTVRQLLCHAGGFEGDIFTDTGCGSTCIENYVAGLADVTQISPPGAMFSYNNAAFNVLGRIVEVLRGRQFDECLDRHLVQPLGLTHVATGPHEAIRFRAATGHLTSADGQHEPAPVWSLPRSTAPAGGVLAMRARDLVGFACMHLADGRAPDGTPIITAWSARAMQTAQITLPGLGAMGSAWGLGWELFDDLHPRMIGHDGATIGQSAFLRVVPSRNVVVVLLANGGDTDGLERAVVAPVLRELAGAQLPALPVPPSSPLAVDVDRFLGRYVCDVAAVEVDRDDEGRTWVSITPRGELMNLVQDAERREVVPYRNDALITREPTDGRHSVYVFLGRDGAGRAEYVQTSRAVRRAADG